MISKTFVVHPSYEVNEQNFDICVIKAVNDENKSFDLSEQFESIPCMPTNFNLTKVDFGLSLEKKKKN